MFVLPLSLAYANWASQEGCFTRGPQSGPQSFLCSIFTNFSLCLFATTILDSFFLF